MFGQFGATAVSNAEILKTKSTIAVNRLQYDRINCLIEFPQAEFSYTEPSEAEEKMPYFYGKYYFLVEYKFISNIISFSNNLFYIS